ncbi:transmembrane protein 156 [Peromyscus californicus insignis]|uniref:transmembrane protein 156 n=1 Tax=Peromyscus californicus insignis TaxID=564181 RepID=UPI0022A6A65B|nr:transmembrane protein 156 [Peromyscus californicus insignis]
MTETALFKLFVAIVVTFILVLPEFFKTPKERTQELACWEVCLLPNLTYPLPSFNFSSVASLQPAEETQTVMGVFPNYSSSPSFAEICQGITRGFSMCSLCLVCKSNGDFTSQEQTSKGLIMRGSMEVKANDVYSPCQLFNVTVALLVDAAREYNTTCTPETHPGNSTTIDEEPTKEDSLNHTCGIMGNTSNCTHISMSLEMAVKPVTCSVKITWYILVLLVFMVGIILIIHKILEDHRRVQRWQSKYQGKKPVVEYEGHKSKSTAFLLRGSDSAKLSTLNVRVIPESTRGLPSAQVVEVLPPIPEFEVTSAVPQQDQYPRLSLDNLDQRL